MLMSKIKFSLDPQKVEKINTEYRLIQSSIPAPGTIKILNNLDKFESRAMHGQLPIVWDKANDFSIYDIAGNCWIDFTSAIFLANVGHSNKHVSDAMKQTLNYSLYSCYAYANPIRAKYMEKLVKFAGKPFEKAFLVSSGTEATESTLKLMRMDGDIKKKKRKGIICIENNWHGRTLGSQMLSGNKAQREWIGYQDADIHHIPFPYPWAMNGKSGEEFLKDGLKNLTDKGIDLSKDICGFMLETFQGWGAVFYPKDFVKSIKEICIKNKIILAFDEMQSGFGRTGKAFGFQHYEVEPDLIACGKGMGGGVPLSGVIGKKEILDLPSVGNMSSTHSANPLVCAAGIAVLEELESKNLINEAERKGKLFYQELNKLKNEFPKRLSWVLGHGMVFALLFIDPKTNLPDSLFASKVAERCMQKGVLVVHTGRESIKLGPPLTMTDAALLEGISVIKESISEIISND